MKYGNGRLPREFMMESIEFYGVRVKPLVLDMFADWSSEVIHRLRDAADTAAVLRP